MRTSLRRRPLAACAAAAATALALTACLPGDDGSDRASGSDSSSSSSEPGSESEGGQTEESFTAPEQRELTPAEAKKVLPTQEDMPDRTYLQDGSEEMSQTSGRWTYDPPACAAVEFATESARSFRDKQRTAYEYARFKQPQSAGGKFLGAWVSSYDEPFPLAYFDQAGENLGTCKEFNRTSPRGNDFHSGTTAIPAPPLGERAFSVRLVGDRFNTDRLHVRSGHNLITIMQQTPSKEPFDERPLEKHAQSVLDDLKKAS